MYQVRWNVYGHLEALERLDWSVTNDCVWCFPDYLFYDVQIGSNTIKFYCTFNHFQLVTFTFKFGLQISYQKIIMALNFCVAIYLVGKLIFR